MDNRTETQDDAAAAPLLSCELAAAVAKAVAAGIMEIVDLKTVVEGFAEAADAAA
jgi:hypothetical protein